MNSAEFWREAQRRRDHFFLAWVGWPVAALPLIGIYSLLLPDDWPFAPMAAALLTYFPFWIWLAYRVTQLRCFQCGERALGGPFFVMHCVKCGSCGVGPDRV